MSFRDSNPLVVQGDRTVLLDVHSPRYEEARDALCRFAELEKSPEHVHTYRLSPLSLWNAASAGLTTDDVSRVLEDLGRYPVPAHVAAEVRDVMARHGRLRLERTDDATRLHLVADDPALLRQVRADRRVAPLVMPTGSPDALAVAPARRGEIKRVLLRVGFPVEDRVGFREGPSLAIALRETALSGRPFTLRGYQAEAAEVFHQGGAATGGHGVVVLPCGSGKTVVGLAVLALVRRNALVLVTNVTAARQWRREILDKTTLTDEQVGLYVGDEKQVRPVTVATYQILTWRPARTGPFPHFAVFSARDWGLVIHDEVHLLPAPVFRATADLQATRRLGLTATLVREDGLEGDVFSLIGPKRHDVPWKDMERLGFIAVARCREVRMEVPEEIRVEHALASARERSRVAAENPRKEALAEEIVRRHEGDSILIIGQYLDQLDSIARRLGAPLLTGRTPDSEREDLYRRFREGELRLLVVSKVANFAVDLPDASVAVQVSGTFGSRQEEAQRLGRILRPKERAATLYSLVSGDTVEQDHAMKRRLFLTEQGYRYDIVDEAALREELAAAAAGGGPE